MGRIGEYSDLFTRYFFVTVFEISISGLYRESGSHQEEA
jgi:hypothetical protein